MFWVDLSHKSDKKCTQGSYYDKICHQHNKSHLFNKSYTAPYFKCLIFKVIIKMHITTMLCT